MSENGAQEITKLGIKRERFIRIIERRVNIILDGLDNLGKCSNNRNYDYTDEEVRKIFREIDRKVREVKLQFQSKGGNKRRFRLYKKVGNNE